MNDKIMKIRGEGEAILPPDTIEISFVLEKRGTNYSDVIKQSNLQLEYLRGCLVEEGFSQDSLETTNFNVDSEFENVKNPAGEYTSIFSNYVVRHHLKLAFDMDAQLLSRVIHRISQCQAQPMIRIDYTLKDNQNLLAIALEEAYKHALLQANVLANVSSVTIGDIIEIIHDEISARPFPMQTLRLQEATLAGAVEFYPEEISLSTTILVTWRLI